MEWKLELIVVPVTDVDRAKAFYLEKTGFNLLVDVSHGEDFRVVQLTPPGSACSIALMKMPDNAGRVQGLHLIVSDIDAARAQLTSRGVEASDPFHFEEGVQKAGGDPAHADYNSFITFTDPDGNGWMVQEVGRSTAAS